MFYLAGSAMTRFSSSKIGFEFVSNLTIRQAAPKHKYLESIASPMRFDLTHHPVVC